MSYGFQLDDQPGEFPTLQSCTPTMQLFRLTALHEFAIDISDDLGLHFGELRETPTTGTFPRSHSGEPSLMNPQVHRCELTRLTLLMDLG